MGQIVIFWVILKGQFDPYWGLIEYGLKANMGQIVIFLRLFYEFVYLYIAMAANVISQRFISRDNLTI
jgi:hypothetical protein